MDKGKLLEELCLALKSMPPPKELVDNTMWLGRTKSLLNKWNNTTTVIKFPSMILTSHPSLTLKSHQQIETLLHEAISDIQFDTCESTNLLLGAGQPYDFYNIIRKVIEKAEKEVFFIDNYLNADFVERYFPIINDNIHIKLMTAENPQTRTLQSAIDIYYGQHKCNFTYEIRKSDAFHDRYLIIDQKNIFQSSGSFKDGANKKPTTLIEIHDIAPQTLALYNDIWQKS